MNKTYLEFLQAKMKLSENSGFDIDEKELIPALLPHQRDVVIWAIKGGRRALFESFGLGKTLQQLEICRIITEKEGGKALIVCPLGVKQEFKKDAKRFYGIDIPYVKTQEECEAQDHKILITNYERVRDGNINPLYFKVTSLDEASVLRSYGSLTYQSFLNKFRGVKYKYVCTATPSPNKYKELIHYAGYLEIMDTGQALTRFFKRDSTKANNLKLHPHKETEFWLWLNSWAIFLTKPSDLGYSDIGYDLPKLNIHYHCLKADHLTAGQDQDGQVKMFRNAALGLKDASKEKRDSLPDRVEYISKILYLCINSLNDYDKGRKEIVLPKMVSGKQIGIIGKTESSEQIGLSKEQREISGKIKELEIEESRKIQRTCEELPEQKQRENNSEIERMVCEQQGESEPTVTESKTEIVWNRPKYIFQYVNPTEQPVCDLQNYLLEQNPENLSAYRSLSQDGESKGLTLSQLQYCDWTIKRQSSSGDGGLQLFSKQFIIWCDLNSEQKAIEKMLKSIGISFVSLYGNESIEKRETDIGRWKNREVSVFLSKPEMYGSGINMQQCHKMIFAGIGYKFNSFIQAIHRIYRFLQYRECDIDIIYSESETEILRVLKEKWQQHNELVKQMTDIIKENGLNIVNAKQKLMRTIGIERKEERGEYYTAILNDCVVETETMKENSVDLIHTSIPFSNHYEYTPTYNDFGHTDDNDHFFAQMDYLTPQLLRILKPGRVCAVHVKDRILFGNTTGDGMPTLDPFSDFTVMHFLKHGFRYFGRVTVETDVVRENNQTYRLGWTEQCKDGSKMGVGCPEYVLLFRKLPSDTSKAYADYPVTKTKKDYTRGQWQIDARAKWNSSGDRFLTPDEIKQLPIDRLNVYFYEYMKNRTYDYSTHINTAKQMDDLGKLPATFQTLNVPSRSFFVWDDVNRMLTLNSAQSQKKLNMHICPLQFDIVDRIINRFSNKGEVVFDPFAGLFTVPFRAMKLGRKGIGTELNPESFRDGLFYLKKQEIDMTTPTLFNLIETEVA